MSRSSRPAPRCRCSLAQGQSATEPAVRPDERSSSNCTDRRAPAQPPVRLIHRRPWLRTYPYLAAEWNPSVSTSLQGVFRLSGSASRLWDSIVQTTPKLELL